MENSYGAVWKNDIDNKKEMKQKEVNSKVLAQDLEKTVAIQK